MLLFENPEDVLTAVEGGVDIKELNVGYGRRVHAVGGTDGGREGSETSAEKEKAQERKKFVKHMYNEKTLKDETGKLFGRHLRMP